MSTFPRTNSLTDPTTWSEVQTHWSRLQRVFDSRRLPMDHPVAKRAFGLAFEAADRHDLNGLSLAVEEGIRTLEAVPVGTHVPYTSRRCESTTVS